MTTLATHHSAPARTAVLVTAVVLVAALLALGVVMLLTPASSSGTAPATPEGGGPVAVCPALPVSAC